MILNLLKGFIGMRGLLILLFFANVGQGLLLKSAWTKNAQAILMCENNALRDAQLSAEAVNRELFVITAELRLSTLARQSENEKAEKEIAERLRKKEIEHANVIADMEAATNEIADDEFFCATEPVSAELLIGMRNAAFSYNQNRNSPDT